MSDWLPRQGGTVSFVADDENVSALTKNKQPITMLGDRVLLVTPASEGERKSRSGILIPATASVAKRLMWADVAAVGPNVRTVRSGDVVLYNPEECFEVEVQGDTYIILRERDLHAIASDRLDSGTGLYL
jgi:chaperonin GroES